MTEKNCVRCEAPGRIVWPANRGPGLGVEPIDVGNWITLESCESCQTLWNVVPYEPFAGYRYCVQWQHPKEAWRTVHDIDDGLTLLSWHHSIVYEVCLPMLNQAGPDAEAVTRHFERSSGLQPFKDPPQEPVSIEQILKRVQTQ